MLETIVNDEVVVDCEFAVDYSGVFQSHLYECVCEKPCVDQISFGSGAFCRKYSKLYNDEGGVKNV